MASTLALVLGVAVVVIGTLATVAIAAGEPPPLDVDDTEDRVATPAERGRPYSFRYEPLSEERPARELVEVLERLLPGLGVEGFPVLSTEEKSRRLAEAAEPIGEVGPFTLKAARSTSAGEGAVWEAPSYGGLEGRLLVISDTAMADTLIALFLGPPTGTEYDLAVTLVKIVLRPHEFFIKIATMTVSAVLNTHGLGVLGPAVGRSLTRLRNRILGLGTPKPGIFKLLDGLEHLAYGQDGRLTDSPTFRAWWARMFGKQGRRRSEHDRRRSGPSPSPGFRSAWSAWLRSAWSRSSRFRPGSRGSSSRERPPSDAPSGSGPSSGRGDHRDPTTYRPPDQGHTDPEQPPAPVQGHIDPEQPSNPARPPDQPSAPQAPAEAGQASTGTGERRDQGLPPDPGDPGASSPPTDQTPVPPAYADGGQVSPGPGERPDRGVPPESGEPAAPSRPPDRSSASPAPAESGQVPPAQGEHPDRGQPPVEPSAPARRPDRPVPPAEPPGQAPEPPGQAPEPPGQEPEPPGQAAETPASSPDEKPPDPADGGAGSQGGAVRSEEHPEAPDEGSSPSPFDGPGFPSWIPEEPPDPPGNGASGRGSR
jgi:hypothetical protein